VNALINFFTRNPLAAFLAVVIITLFLWVAILKWDIRQANQARAEVTTERDAIALVAAEDRAKLAGWEVTNGVFVGNLHKMLRERDTAMATLVQDLRASRVSLSYLAEVNITLRGQVESFGSPVGTSEDQTPSQWAGEIDDGLLRTSWGFWAVDARLLLDPYWVDISGELVGAESGDGQHVVFGRAFDPRVTLSLGEYHFQPPPIEVRDHCSWTRMGVVGGFGFLGGMWAGR